MYHNKDIERRFRPRRIATLGRVNDSCRSIRPAVFVHVPKAAGHAIETVLHEHHIENGRFGRWESQATAPYVGERIGTLRGCTGNCQAIMHEGKWCSRHHRPPAHHVPGGLVVVREPIDRAVSEFCYSLPFLVQWFQRAFAPSCDAMNEWVPFILDKYLERAGVVLDCHLLPQWRFASKVDVIIGYAELTAGNGWERIRKHFELPENATLPADVDQQKAGAGAQAVCKRQVSRACLSTANTQRLRDFFREDYENLASYF